MEENIWSIKVKENGEGKKKDSLSFTEKKDRQKTNQPTNRAPNKPARPGPK